MFINSDHIKQRVLRDNPGVETLQPKRFVDEESGLFEEDGTEVEAVSTDTCPKCGSQTKGKSETFRAVFDEMSANVPDRTSTIEEKKLAVSYIDRMLACNDISQDLKVYWQNKKSIIQQEIVRIKNEQKVGSGEKTNDVWKELTDFADKFRKGLNDSVTGEDRKEYLDTFNSTCITYYMRLLTCKDATPRMMMDYIKSIFDHISDMRKS